MQINLFHLIAQEVGTMIFSSFGLISKARVNRLPMYSKTVENKKRVQMSVFISL